MSTTSENTPSNKVKPTISENIHRVDAVSAHLRNYIVGASFGFVGIAIIFNKDAFQNSLHLGPWRLQFVSPWDDVALVLFGLSFGLVGGLLLIWNAVSGFLKLLEAFNVPEPKSSPLRHTLLLVFVFFLYLLFVMTIVFTLGTFAENLARQK